jgi:CBS domain-containing protein
MRSRGRCPAHSDIHGASVPRAAREAAADMLRFGIHRVLVMEDDKLCGLVTTIDLMRALAEPQR